MQFLHRLYWVDESPDAGIGWSSDLLACMSNSTERNKWYILTHLGESGYCLQTSTNCWVNWPNCCKFPGQWPRSVKSAEMKITIYPSACMLLNLLYYTIEKCRFESPLWHWVSMEISFIFYSYYIVRTGYMYIYIYTMLAMYVLYVLVSFYEVILHIYLP